MKLIQLLEISGTFLHYTSLKSAKKIIKTGFKVSRRGVFGTGVYLTVPGVIAASKGPHVIETKIENANLCNDYNNKNAYTELRTLSKAIYPKDLSLYFLEKGYDGLDLRKFSFEPQIVIYNLKVIKGVRLSQ